MSHPSSPCRAIARDKYVTGRNLYLHQAGRRLWQPAGIYHPLWMWKAYAVRVSSLSHSCKVTGAANCWVWKRLLTTAAVPEEFSVNQVLLGMTHTDCISKAWPRSLSRDIISNLHLRLSRLWHTNHSPQRWLGHLLVVAPIILTLWGPAFSFSRC